MQIITNQVATGNRYAGPPVVHSDILWISRRRHRTRLWGSYIVLIFQKGELVGWCMISRSKSLFFVVLVCLFVCLFLNIPCQLHTIHKKTFAMKGVTKKSVLQHHHTTTQVMNYFVSLVVIWGRKWGTEIFFSYLRQKARFQSVIGSSIIHISHIGPYPKIPRQTPKGSPMNT